MQQLRGVTGFIKSFFPEFDKERVAKKCALKDGRTAEEIILEWEVKGQRAINIGEYTHDHIEERLLSKTCHYEKEIIGEYEPYKDGADLAIDRLFDNYNLESVELEVSSLKYGLTGYVDVVFSDYQDNIIILDWKTSEKIKYKNRFSRGLDPIGDLDDCNYIHYALQLNTYKKMLIDNNTYPDKNIKMGIVHIKPHGYNFVKVLDTLQPHVDKMILSLTNG